MRIILTLILSAFFIGLSSAQCQIKEMTATPTECNANGEFFVKINFTHVGTTNQFTINGNGKEYGKYTYTQLPLTLGPLKADCATAYEFVVRDVINTGCTAFKEVGKKCCNDNCSISIKNAEAGECDGSLYTAHFNLVYTVAENSSKFIVKHNGDNVDTLEYTKDRIHVPGLMASNFNTFETIVICDLLNPTCCDTVKLVNPCICSIYDVRYQVVDCSEENENFDLRIDFKHNMVSDSFLLGGNGTNFGKFAYSSLPIKLNNLPFMGAEAYEFLIVDSDNALCFNSLELGKVQECNFECNIDDVYVKKGECINDSIYLLLDFKYKNTSLEGFSISGDGLILGSFEYGEGPYVLGPFKQDCGKELEFVVFDNGQNSCSSSVLFDDGLCCGCALSELSVNEFCDGEKLIAFDVNFDHHNASGQFYLFIGDKNLGKFNYADLPIKISNIDNITQTINIKIVDASNESCRLLKTYEFDCNVKAECSIRDLTVKASDCNEEGKFFAILKFISEGTSTKLVVKVNGVAFDTIIAGLGTYEIGPLTGDCVTSYKFLVYDIDNPACGEDGLLGKVCCDEKECKISEPIVAYQPCVDGKYSITLKFEHENTTSTFKVKANDKIFGPFNYNNLPVTLTELLPGKAYEITIQDSDKPDCKLFLTIPAIECTSDSDDATSDKIFTYISYPNLLIETSNQKVNLNVFDAMGKQVISNQIIIDEAQFNISEWPSGVYFVMIELENGRRVVRKVMR